MADTLLLDRFAIEGIEEENETKTFKYITSPFIFSIVVGNTIPEKINVLPKPGNYTNNIYGKISITKESNEEFIDNFNKAVYQSMIPIDLEHETQLSGAVGFMRSGTGYLDEEGAGWVSVEWNSRGATMLQEKRFAYFSPAWVRKWSEPASGKIFNNVLVGGALTNSPFFKEGSLKPLFFSEMLLDKEKEIKKEEKMESTATVNTITVEQFNALQAQMNENIKSSAEEAKRREEAEKKVQSMGEQLQKANENLVKFTERDKIQRFTGIIRGVGGENDGSPSFPGEAKTHLNVLEALNEKFGEDSEEFKAYVAHERGLAEQLKESALLKNIGGKGASNPKNVSGETEYFAEVAKVASAKNIGTVEAQTIVARENPALYQKYRKSITSQYDEGDE